MKNYTAQFTQNSPTLAKISQNYPKLYNHFGDKFSKILYLKGIYGSENLQERVDFVSEKVDQSMQPAYVAGALLRNFYDYFFPQQKSKDFVELSSISGDTISTAQLQSYIDSKRNQSADGYVDLSDLSGLKLEGEALEVPVDDDDDRISGVDLGDIKVFSGLNVSRTNFPQVFSLNSSYFYNSDFSQNRFESMSNVFFDGCNLDKANMAQTMQSNLYFAGVSSYFLVAEITKIKGYLLYPEVHFRDLPTTEQIAAFDQQLQILKTAYSQLKSTQVTNVNLTNVRFLNGVYDDQTTNYQNTSFGSATFDFPYSTLIGKNLDLNAASYKLENGSYFKIKEAISAEEIEREVGSYVAAILRNNNIQPRNGKKTVFAMSPTGLNSDVANSTNKCNEVFGSGPTYAPVNMAHMGQIISSFNQMYAQEFNVEFVADDNLTPYDFRFTLCNTWDAPRWGAQTLNSALVDRENYIEISRILINMGVLAHELNHALGGNHPFDAGVLPTACSHFASSLCYSGGMDLMLPITNETKPLRLQEPQPFNSFDPQDIAVSDHKFLTIILGKNPAFHQQDVATNLYSDSARIIHSDSDHNNTALINTASLGKVKYAVLNASQSIGSCYKFPCDPTDMAAGVKGVLVVFYDDSSGAPVVTGNALLFGGKVNQVIVDGKVVEPINPASPLVINGETVTPAKFQAEINRRKRSSNGAIIDLNDLQDVVIKTTSISLDEYNKIDAIEGIDFTGTNFAQIPKLINEKYFKNCNFTGCYFGNTVDTTFDGCDLTNADMSNTIQTGIILGADLERVRGYIGFTDTTIHQLVDRGSDYSNEVAKIASYKKFIAETKPTKFVNVNLSGATRRVSKDIYRTGFDAVTTDYNQTDFTGVKMEFSCVPIGQNLNLEGALIKTPYSSNTTTITDPVSAEEVNKRFGVFMDSMVRNAIIHRPNPEKKTIIAISSALQDGDRKFFDKCLEVYPYENTTTNFIPVNISDIQNLANIYNEEYHKYNIEFMVDKSDQPRDFRLNICFNVYAGAGQAGSIGLINSELYINLGFEANRQTILHEFGHLLGASHPGENIIEPTKCSVMASTMCYPNALDIMMPLGSSALPGRISYESQENLGPQDHQLAGFLFSENPNYQPQDYRANITVGHSRIISGDSRYNNSVILNTTSLEEGTKWIVLDAQKSIGTCYNFPCGAENLADGLSGNLLVLYKENPEVRPTILGTTLIYGGRENNVIVDGQIIKPIDPFPDVVVPFADPSRSPLRSPSQVPTPHKSDLSTKSSTESSTESSTKSSTESSTNSPTESSTKSSTKSSTESSTNSPTIIPTESSKGSPINSDPKDNQNLIIGVVAALGVLSIGVAAVTYFKRCKESNSKPSPQTQPNQITQMVENFDQVSV